MYIDLLGTTNEDVHMAYRMAADRDKRTDNETNGRVDGSTGEERKNEDASRRETKPPALWYPFRYSLARTRY